MSHAGGQPQPAFRSVALFFPMQASSSSQDLTNAAAPSRWSSAARASRSMPARVNRWRVSSMLRPASCSRWVAFMLPPSGAAASAARAVPPADLRRQRRGLWGAPAGGLVLVHGRRRAENGLDDRPRRFDGVLPREERRVARHRIAEEPLVGVHLLPVRVVDHVQLRRLGDHLLSRPLHAGADGYLHLRTQLEKDVVRVPRREPAEGRPAQRDQHLGRRGPEALARPDEERHAVPAPRIDVEPRGGERLHRGVRGDAFLLPVAAELPADQVVGPQRADGPEHLHLLVPDRLVIGRRGSLHGEEPHHLQHVILDDVADRARLLVEAAAPLDPEALGHSDLHALDVVAVPDRLEERVREAEDEEVLHRLLPEVVVDAEDARLVEDFVQRLVEGLRRGEIPPEGLFDDDARVAGAARSPEPPDHGLEQARRDGEVVERAFRAAERSAQRLERGRIAVVAAHVAKPFAKPRECRLVEPSVPLDALPGARPELLERPVRPRDADDGDVEMPAPGHGVEGRKDLLVGEVAARPEDDEPVGAWRAHLPGPFSTWPPNSNRMAESRRSWKSASPLEAKRSKSAAAST